MKNIYYTIATIASVVLMFSSLYMMGISNSQAAQSEKLASLTEPPTIQFVEVYIYDLPEVVKTSIAREFEFKNVHSTSMGRGRQGDVLIRVIVREGGTQIVRFYSPKGERLDKI